MFSAWTSTSTEADKPKQVPQRLTRETYIPTVLDESTIPVKPNETLVENARIQQRIWGRDLDSPVVNPIHLACLMGNTRTLHTLLSKGFHCPKVCMQMTPNGITPLMLIASQMDDKTANICTEMFCEALEACNTGQILPKGKFGYVACIKCFKHIADKPVLQDTNETETECL